MMKTVIVLCALASIGVAAPAPPGEVPEVTKQTHLLEHLDTLDMLNREKKSPANIESSTSPSTTTEVQFVDRSEPTTTAARSFLKKPLIVKKKHGYGNGYRLYRDSEEEKASADSYEACGRQVKVKLCDEDRKFKHPLKKSSQDQDLHMTEEDVKHSIKMAKEAVENLQRDLKHMENTSGMKMTDESEADNELREDIEVARQALEHIHENFGNLETINLHSTTSTNSEAMRDVRVTIAKTDEERLAQWKEAMDNIQKNVEVAKNIEQSLKMAGKEDTLLNVDQTMPEIDQAEQKVEENIGSQMNLIAESHTRASDKTLLDELQTDKTHHQEDTIQEVNENRPREHHTEEDMKVSASEIKPEITDAQGQPLNNHHLLRSGEETERNYHKNHEAQLGKSSIHDMDETEDFSEKQETFSKVISDDTISNSPDMNLMFKSEDNENKEIPQLVNLKNEDVPSLHTKSAEQLNLAAENLAAENLQQNFNIHSSEHIDMAARQLNPSAGKVIEEAKMHSGKISEQLDVKSLDMTDQPDISMFIKNAGIGDIQEHHKKIDNFDSTSSKSAEENIDNLDTNTDNNMQTTMNVQSFMRNVDEQVMNMQNDHLHKMSPTDHHEEFKHFNADHMRQSHLPEVPSIENVQDFTEDIHFDHMRNVNLPNSHWMNTGENANNFHLSHLRNSHFTNTMKADGELNHNFPMENMPSTHISDLPSMRAADEHMKHSHLDHLRHSHLAHPHEVTEDFDTQMHIDHMRTPHLEGFARMNPGENFHQEHLKHMEGHDHMVHNMGMGHEQFAEHPHSGLHHSHHPHHPHHSHHHHDRFRQMDPMTKKMHEMSGLANPKFHSSMRDAMEGFGSENRFRWQPAHESARGAYGAGSVAPAGAVGVFPNANSGGCGIPLLLSCSPSVVSGSLAKPHSGYGAPAYRSDDEFSFHNKRDIKNTNKLRSNNVLRSSNIIKQKTGTVLENKL